MSIAIIHLSDLHFRGGEAGLDRIARSITQRANRCIRKCDAVVIAITGDIAFSGKEKEYDSAKKLIESIVSLIEKKDRKLYIITCPGNHDCDFSGSQDVRDMLIGKMKDNPEDGITDDIIRHCLSVQSEYESFSDWCLSKSDEPARKNKGLLYSIIAIESKGEVIEFCSLNAAWMSQIKEAQGELLFPRLPTKDDVSEDVSARIGLIHHPLNWYSQSSYHPLRSFVKGRVSILLSGHEHSGSTYFQTDSGGRDTLLLEAASLFPGGDEAERGFSILKIDSEDGVVEVNNYSEGDDDFEESDSFTRAINSRKLKSNDSFEINCNFLEVVKDPGGNFTKNGIQIDNIEDVYVFPDLKKTSSGDEGENFCSDKILDESFSSKAIVIGDEKSGRTSFLHQVFTGFFRQGKFPVIIDATSLASVSKDSLERHVRVCFVNQYDVSKDNFDCFTLDNSRLCLLIDNLDGARGGMKNVARLLSASVELFDHVVASADMAFSFSEMIGKDIAEITAVFDTFEIAPFGRAQRLKLIQKWCLLSGPKDKAELDKRTYDCDRMINAVVGTSMVPASPFYLMILLQSIDLNDAGRLQNAAFSDYYHYLLVKGLMDAGVPQNEYLEVFNYLACLAWWVRDSEDYFCSDKTLNDFNDYFGEKYTRVDLEKRKKALLRARILSRGGGGFYFRYPYEYYYCLGKYIGDRSLDDDVADFLKYCAETINKKRSADIILFYLYHQKDSGLIQRLTHVLSECFSVYEELDLVDQAIELSALVDGVSKVEVDCSDTDKNQIAVAEMQDNAERGGAPRGKGDFDLPVKDGASDAENLIRTIYLMFRVSEILGQILTVYYGVMERDVKKVCIGEIFSSHLRLAGLFVSTAENNIDSFVSTVHSFFLRGEETSSEQEKRASAFHYAALVISGLLIKAIKAISSDKLSDDIVSIESDNENLVYKILRLGHVLSMPNEIPISELRSTLKECAENRSVFEVLRVLVLYRITLFHTKSEQKQQVFDLFEISQMDRKRLALNSRKKFGIG